MKSKMLFVAITVLFGMVFVGCGDSATTIEAPSDETTASVEEASTGQMPEDFDFKLGNELDIIDTYEDTYQGTETISFTIPPEEMEELYKVFTESSIETLPDDINADVDLSGEGARLTAEPAIHYTLTYTSDGVTKTISCNTGGPWQEYGPPETYHRFFTFVDSVFAYTESTSEVQALPQREWGLV